jgi:hypothetical protein
MWSTSMPLYNESSDRTRVYFIRYVEMIKLFLWGGELGE